MAANFSEFKESATLRQLTMPEVVADEIKDHFKLMESEDDILWIAGFIVFLFGERLGKWQEGSDLLRKLKNNTTVKDKLEMKRLTAMMKLGNNPNLPLEAMSDADRFIVLSSTAKSLAGLGALKNAQRLLNEALEIDSVTHSDDLQRARVKLGLNYLKAGKIQEARSLAETVLEKISHSNTEAESLDLFDAYFILAEVALIEEQSMGVLSSLNGMRLAFDKLDDHYQKLNQSRIDLIETKV